ncbi:hypothetical protein F3J17_09145 [Burkholderia sp. Ax-1719]|nr:hypothetical protein [Burkholderia sp. Ax-1719]
MTMPTRCGFGELVEDDESGFVGAGIDQDQVTASGMSGAVELRASDPMCAGDGRLAVDVCEVIKVDRLNLLHVSCYFLSSLFFNNDD